MIPKEKIKKQKKHSQISGGIFASYGVYNLYAKTKKYGNIYLIQLHPTVAGDQYSNECMREIIRAVMK